MSPKTPAENLTGQEVGDGRRVVEQHPRDPNATGGTFSVGWIVERGNEKAFLKATDVITMLRGNPKVKGKVAVAEGFVVRLWPWNWSEIEN